MDFNYILIEVEKKLKESPKRFYPVGNLFYICIKKIEPKQYYYDNI